MQSLSAPRIPASITKSPIVQRLDLVLATIDDGQPATCLAPATINRLLAAISSFYEYLILSGHWGIREPDSATPGPNACASGGTPPSIDGAGESTTANSTSGAGQTVQRVPRPLSPEQVDGLLGAARTWRDRAMLLLMLQGGFNRVRCSTYTSRMFVLGVGGSLCGIAQPPEGCSHQVANGAGRRPPRARSTCRREPLRDGRAAA